MYFGLRFGHKIAEKTSLRYNPLIQFSAFFSKTRIFILHIASLRDAQDPNNFIPK
jgi:hypothetical protein